MDAALGSFTRLHVPSFARRWKVSTKTVHRDLEAFRQLGQGVVGQRDADGQRHVWFYEDGVEWLFLSNMSPRIRAELQQLLDKKRSRPPG